MSELASAGAGFLLAVLWFDLMFDVQVLGHRGDELPEQVLASIAAYYRRVTTAARPMNRLVAVAMLTTIAAVSVEVARGDVPRWVAWTSLVLVVFAVLVAVSHTFGAARRLGAWTGSRAEQSRLARSILRDHVVCLATIASLLAVQIGFS